MNDLIKNSLKTHSEALHLINESDIINSANIILNAINEGKTIFSDSWVFVGYKHELKNIGDVIPITIAEQPILLV